MQHLEEHNSTWLLYWFLYVCIYNLINEYLGHFDWWYFYLKVSFVNFVVFLASLLINLFIKFFLRGINYINCYVNLYDFCNKIGNCFCILHFVSQFTLSITIKHTKTRFTRNVSLLKVLLTWNLRCLVFSNFLKYKR